VKLNSSWELVLGSQFHDILPGTSIPKAYEYAWNDEFIAANGFSQVLKNSISVISAEMNTTVQGRAIIVYNPVAVEREDVVTAELTYSKLPGGVKVFDKDGKEILSQVLSSAGNKLTLIFLADMPPAGIAVFDVRETIEKPAASLLTVADRSLENKYFRVTIDDNGDISSIYDKTASREVLSNRQHLISSRRDLQHGHHGTWTGKTGKTLRLII